MKRAEEGLGAGQELYRRGQVCTGILVCRGQEAGDGSEGSHREAGVWESSGQHSGASQPSLLLGASLHALDPLPPTLTFGSLRWLTGDSV